MKLYWIDLETTGTDSHKDSILEIVVKEAEFKDPFNAKLVHHAVFWFHPDMVKNQSPFIIDMHTKNGLFKECADEERARDVFESEDELLKIVKVVEDKDDRATLAGSSISLDHAFLKAWMPRLSKRLSHRHYDVRSVALYCQSMGMPAVPKAEAHRAMADIDESIALGRHCTTWLHHTIGGEAIYSRLTNSELCG